MTLPIHVLGMGPGHPDYILPAALKLIERSEVLVGGQRHLDAYTCPGKICYPIRADLDELVKAIRHEQTSREVAILLSGEPGYYGMLTFLRRHFSAAELNVIPGISAFQYLMAKIGEPWQESALASLHGRHCDFMTLIQSHRQAIFLTDSKQSPHWLAEQLQIAGLQNIEMIVGANLSYPEELIVRGQPADVLKQLPFGLSTVVINNHAKK